jgi:large subunit ribosomal protein L1
VSLGKRYPLEEALTLVKETASANFDETVEVAIRLGVNPRQADQNIRGAVPLPHGSGKPVRVVVFAEGDAARAAEEAGADFVGSTQLIEKIQKEGWLEFDKAIAVRSLMAKVGRLGRVLGPRGLMPNPKTGTVVAPGDVAAAVKEVKGGRVDFRVERKGAVVHAGIGKVSMPVEHVQENFLTLLRTLLRMKPSTAKGNYLRSVAVSSTMGVGVRVDPNEAIRVASDSQ